MREQRLISKDALIAFIKSNGYVYANSLETFPEVDAVPVVRCGKCKHSKESKSVSCAYICDCKNQHCPCSGRITTADFYCQCGERKESKVES